MKTPCKECPWVVKNKHNDVIINFSIRSGRSHNCHMTKGVKNLWDVKEKYKCVGKKITIK